MTIKDVTILYIPADITNAAQVFPTNYKIQTAAVYEDPACQPSSSEVRGSHLSAVSCEQRGDDAPKLIDSDCRMVNSTGNTTDYAYTLMGPSDTGLFERWLQFNFKSFKPLSAVTLHYACSGEPPQFQLDNNRGTKTSPFQASCDNTTQCLMINASELHSIKFMTLEVQRSRTVILYLSEVQFFTEGITHSMICMHVYCAFSTFPGDYYYSVV